ncbi:CBS domain-containing protein [Desulfofundulus thermocisternus]|uniref:CBS domain-containing protein n=1 Tax=Desulfofundulus thermocisternus TaxID=42471 RepID=UPI0019F49BAB|nr:CBS domain-containing protein [Desulfofundulus thermocisternus]MBE3586670.1 CBS domain-containing protein [Thermoanaerobacter sp.]MCS5694512.1 CBS domain-containing protein [Desulfofundulus thermocisternus]
MPALVQSASNILARSFQREKTVGELMVSLEACRTISADCSFKEAVNLMKRVALQSRAGAIPPLVVLEARIPAGLLKIHHLLAGAHLPLPQRESYAGWSIPLSSGEPPSYSGLFSTRVQDMAGKKVREVMRPFPALLKPQDPLSRAAFLLAHSGFEILPVVEDGRMVGLIRDKELFLELSRIIAGE